MDHDSHNDHINVWAADSGADHGSGPRDSWEGCVQHNDFLPGTCSRDSASDQKWFRHTNLQKEAEADRKERSRKLSGGSGIILQRVEERRRKSHEKRISVLLLCCIVFISGCNMPGQDDQKIKKLDPEKLDSETTDINDRADYYEKYVTEPGDDMDEEERSKYRVTLHMIYKNAEQYQQDMIIFLRNDNVVEGSMDVGEPDIGLLPGVFRVISMMIEGHDSNLGEIEILEPGMEYTLTIDYAQKKAILSDYDEHK